MIVIIIGVSGSGKSTIAQMLASALSWSFSDADWFHPPENLDKMRVAIPLTDADRMPWLLAVQQMIDRWLQEDVNGVLACSALKSVYRDLLWRDRDRICFVYLKGSFPLIQTRLKQRQNHFMNSDLLQSQFDTLEEPQDAIRVDASQPPEVIVEEIIEKLQFQPS